MEEEEEEEDTESNFNNVATDTSFYSPVAINAQKKYTNVSQERRLALGILEETIKQFKVWTIQSTIKNSAQNDSEEHVDTINDSDEQVDAINNSEELVDAGRDPKRDKSSNLKVDTYTNSGKFPQSLLKSRFVPEIIQGKIGPINQLFTEDVTGIQDILARNRRCSQRQASLTRCAVARTFPNSREGKPHRQGRLHATGRQLWYSDRQVECTKPKF